MAKHDWPLIRREYVEGFDKDGRVHRPTMRELGKRHGIDEANVRRRAKSEAWTAARHEFGTKAALAREAERTAEMGRLGAEFDRTMLDFAHDYMRLVSRAKRNLDGVDLLDELAVMRIGQAARHAQVIAKIALGEAPGGDDLPALPGSGALAATVRVIYDRQPLPGAVSEG